MILAIDLGTQSIKVGLVHNNGIILNISQQFLEVNNPQIGWAQQKPEIWWNLTKKAIKKTLKDFNGDLNQIEGIAVCGQMHGPVGISSDGDITTQWTQIWCDKRCEKICNSIENRYNINELAEITGNPPTTGWSAIKVRWIKEFQKEVYNKSKWFLVPKDFINFKLTGIAATDPSEASGTYLYDIKKDNYSKEIAHIIGIDLDKFAPIYKSYDIIGELKPDIANSLGLPYNLPVIAGGGDFIVSLLGLGLVKEGNAVDMTGTSTLFIVKKEKPILHPSIQNLKHVINGWLPFTMLDCGGLSIAWCRDFLNSITEKEISYEELIDMARKTPIGSQGLLFYPYMLGERRKENVKAKGGFFGLTLEHSAKHLARAVMEGIALAIGKDVQIFNKLGVKIKKVYSVGGATRNRLLSQIKANVMQKIQVIIDEPEASLRGNGLLGAYGLKLINDIEKVARIKSSQNIEIKPEKTAIDRYKGLLNDFIKLYDHMLGYWD